MEEKRLYDVFLFFQINQFLGDSDQAKYLFKYLNELAARTCILEEEYIDKDYLVDYSNFYALSFEDKNRFTKRIHFFSRYFSKNDFINVLENYNQELFKRLEKSYLGLAIIKPIEDAKYNPLIGRTILRPYPQDTNDEHRFYVNGLYSANLFGIPLKIKSLPFQVQDPAVGACALMIVSGKYTFFRGDKMLKTAYKHYNTPFLCFYINDNIK